MGIGGAAATSQKTHVPFERAGAPPRQTRRDHRSARFRPASTRFDQQRTSRLPVHPLGEFDGSLDAGLAIHADHRCPGVQQSPGIRSGMIGPLPQTDQQRESEAVSDLLTSRSTRSDVGKANMSRGSGHRPRHRPESPPVRPRAPIARGRRTDVADHESPRSRGLTCQQHGTAIDRLDRVICARTSPARAVGSERIGQNRAGAGRHVAAVNRQNIGRTVAGSRAPDRPTADRAPAP